MSVNGYTDSELISDFTRGGDNAFKAIHEHYYSELVFLAVQFIKFKPVAEEIVQDSFLKVFKKHKDFEAIGNIKAFLFVTVKNRCLDYIKTERRREERNKQFVDYFESANHFEISRIEGEMLREIFNAFKELPVKYKAIMEMLYIEGLQPKSISTKLSISTATVYNHKKYAVNLLKARILEKTIVLIVLISLFQGQFLFS